MKNELQIKGLKTWSTYDGGGYQYNLYRNKKKVAFVHNQGDGGCLQVEWFDPQVKEEIKGFVVTLPDWQAEGYSGKMTLDIFLEELVSDYEYQKVLAKHRKKGVLFRFLTDPVESFRTLKTLDVAKAVEYLDKNYPNKYVLV
jgi:hypothetical protein